MVHLRTDTATEQAWQQKITHICQLRTLILYMAEQLEQRLDDVPE